MNSKKIFAVVISSLMILLLTACAALKPKPVPTLPVQIPPQTGVQYHYVANSLLIPTTKEQAQAYALNLDGDLQQNPDNLVGDLLTLLVSTAQGIEIQSSVDQTVNAGQLVILHEVKADDPLNDPSVSWLISVGQKTESPPSFNGSDKFTLDSNAPVNSPIIGSLSNGHFTGGPGTARVQMFLLGQKVDVDLIGVRLEADVSATGCTNGKLGGGMAVAEFRAKILPAITDGLNLIINANTSATTSILKVFDADQNGVITIQEVEKNPVLIIAFSPDLDLLDVSNTFNPGQDGVKDSYSIGLGFTCVPANFTGTVTIP
ncbi:MAG: hypothetical protein HY867_00420 [Chloroflexi bacterium]|nr:hypothetical protein [Chloroflexota bacterium]